MSRALSMSMDVTASLADQLAAFLACLLLASAVHKVLHRDAALRATRVLMQLPGGALAPLSLMLAATLEASAAVLLAWSVVSDSGLRAAGASLAALVWTGYSAFMLRAWLQQRRDIDCGCSLSGAHVPLGRYTLARNALLTGLALMSAALGIVPAAVSAPERWHLMILPALTGLALYAALEQVAAVRPLRAAATR